LKVCPVGVPKQLLKVDSLGFLIYRYSIVSKYHLLFIMALTVADPENVEIAPFGGRATGRRIRDITHGTSARIRCSRSGKPLLFYPIAHAVDCLKVGSSPVP
jgi:hypothetical protein